jgi:hypothetical protein
VILGDVKGISRGFEGLRYLLGLVVWNMNFMTFHYIGKVKIPTDELLFFRGIETTNQ